MVHLWKLESCNMSDSLSANHSVKPATPMSEVMENICFWGLLLQSSHNSQGPTPHEKQYYAKRHARWEWSGSGPGGIGKAYCWWSWGLVIATVRMWNDHPTSLVASQHAPAYLQDLSPMMDGNVLWYISGKNTFWRFTVRITTENYHWFQQHTSWQCDFSILLIGVDPALNNWSSTT